jgi:integrase
MAKRRALSETACKNAAPPPGGGQRDIFDPMIGGFALRVSGKSKVDCTKTWTGLWRLNGKPTRFWLGTYPTLRLSAARTKAAEWKEQVRSGVDPRPDKQPKRKPKVETLLDLAALYIDKKVPGLARGAELQSIIERRLLPAWGAYRLDEFDGTEPADICDPLVEAGLPAAARATMEAAKTIMNFAVRRKIISASPFQGLEMPCEKGKRDRVLDDEEICAVWRAANEVGYPGGSLVQLLLLTAQRRSEIAWASWPEINLDKCRLVIPVERVKNRKEHIVHLSDPAVAILEGLPRFVNGNYVLTTTAGRRPIGGFSRIRGRIAKLAGIAPWTFHDLRRTAATRMAELNVAPHVLEKILNHVGGQLGGVAGIYNRYEYLEERKHALDKLARHIERIVTAEENVVPLGV